jgi:V8-like Glu-specific endopeptidase
MRTGEFLKIQLHILIGKLIEKETNNGAGEIQRVWGDSLRRKRARHVVQDPQWLYHCEDRLYLFRVCKEGGRGQAQSTVSLHPSISFRDHREDEAKHHSHPYMTLLQFQIGESKRRCSGILVQEDFVLTAAHCWGR